MIGDEKEKDFQGWVRSISFVNDEGEELPTVLTDDTSEDFDGDRTE